ncbi:unnamed protein product, partial [Didymodactylos carnosus]
MISVLHWSQESKLYSPDTRQYVTCKLFGILRVIGNSGCIKQICQASEWVELYFRKALFTDDHGKFSSTCIETATPARLAMDLASSSKFLSSDDDGPLRKMDFFNPTSKLAKQKQSIIIDAYNGVYQHKKATITDAKDINDRSLTILIPTTGNQWFKILPYFDSNVTN